MNPSSRVIVRSKLRSEVERIVASTPVRDVHTHLYDPAFGSLLLWGLDEMLVYHYLVAEGFRVHRLAPAQFWALNRKQQADLIWESLFVDRSPLSEACRGVLSTLQALGLDPKKKDLVTIRKWFTQHNPQEYVDRCLDLAGVERVCMTNSPFDPQEHPLWMKGFKRDERFEAGLRIDPLLTAWGDAGPQLRQWGYAVGVSLKDQTISQVRRFLADWTKRIKARYLMVSLGPDFDFPSDHTTAQLMEKAVLPHCEEFGLPLALMMGVKRAVNPELGLAGDGVGLSKLSALQNLCAQFPQNKFLVTVLARENQHELCVLARKFRNLHIFGCWWFTNVPLIIDEITRMRLELLGTSFTAQHSDARVLDQLIYKWQHYRRSLAGILAEKYDALVESGWTLTRAEIERDVRQLLGGAFQDFCAPKEG